jgi:hypothetical protein
VDNVSEVDAGMTEPPATESLFSIGLTCENTDRWPSVQVFPYCVHKIRHTLWTTGAQVS